MSSNDLQALFSNLRPRSQERHSASPGIVPFPQPNSRPSSSALFHTAAMPSTPPPPFTATADEPNVARHETSNQTRVTTSSGATAQNLLNLLNFGGPQSTTTASNAPVSTSSPAMPTPQSSSAPISATDLVAKFMSPTTSTPRPEQREEVSVPTQVGDSTTRNQLLEILNRQASATLTGGTIDAENAAQEEDTSLADVPIQSIEVPTEDHGSAAPQEHHNSPLRVFGTAASREHTPFEPPKAASPMPQQHKPIFTYTNPFEALNASRKQTPAAVSSAAPPEPSTPSMFTSEQTVGLSSVTAVSGRKILTPKLRSQRSTTSAAQEDSPVPAETEPPKSEEVDLPAETVNLQPRVETPPIETPPIETPTVEKAESNPTATAENEEEQDKAVDEEQDNQAGSGEWEDADDSPGRDSAPRQIPVYNFPIKAFISITLHLGAGSDIGVRDDGVMEISRLKKEFDQLDRSLTAATSKYIAYAFPKNGGMRIIRQDDGSDRHVFKNSHDRIFNIAFCTTAVNAALSESQAVLGTGVSGTVYYANVSKEGNDLFEKNQLDSESLIFPPYPQADENTAGGVLKTRAKRSSRHPEYFAIGRGKSIQLVWPATALSPRYSISETNRTVDVEKYYADRPLQISTGKAGKDFTFSEDDTMIVSLDKTGRLRFWDIRSLINESNATAARVNPVIIDTPVLSLSTASPAEKSWPTSVTFVDKARPYKKGGALRYVLVGLRQNHTLQLWDIALGKAVQELNFPHENETDGICSVGYHPESGIIVVSHPTRNSIFFIHLSAPRYTLGSQLSQAMYVQRIAAKDPELPKPESTACMSGIREISFAERGQLRSVELLPIQKSAESPKDETLSLFELYVVHSKGVTCLGINREDLGWNAENKPLHPIDAQQEGLVSLKELKLGSIIEEPIRSKSPVKEVLQPGKAAKKKAKKAGQANEEVVNGTDEVQLPQPATMSTEPLATAVAQPETVIQDVTAPKESKKAKKKIERAVQAVEPIPIRSEPTRAASPVREIAVNTIGRLESKINDGTDRKAEVARTDISEEWLEHELRKIEQIVSSGFKKEFDTLYQNIQSDRATQDISSASRQEAILRLVSSSLSTNVEKSLSRILAQQMQQNVVPAVVQQTSAQIAEALPTLATSLYSKLPQEIGIQLPSAVNSALQSLNMNKMIADSVSQKLSKHLESQVADMVVKSVTPVFKNIAVAAAEKAASETEARLSAQLRQLQLDRAADNEKLDKLSHVLEGVANTLHAMSDSQVAFQGQILRDRQASSLVSGSSMVSTSRQVSTARGTPDPISVPKPKQMRIRSKADIELEEITNLMNEGRYEEGSIKWLQSAQPVKLFDELFVRFTPEYLASDVSPLVAFSVAVTVANSLITNTERRLEWISAAFDAVDLQDPEIADLSQHAPALITSLVQKLESLYMTTAERNPNDAILRMIPQLAKKGRDMKSAFIARAVGPIPQTFPPLSTASY